MKATYKTRSGRLLFEVNGETPKALFRGIAEIQNIFESDDTCGACNSPNIQFRVRTVDGNDYYDLACLDCSAQLSYGQNKDGRGLFVKRKDKDGAPLPNRGWTVWKALPEGSHVGAGVVSQPRGRNARPF